MKQNIFSCHPNEHKYRVRVAPMTKGLQKRIDEQSSEKGSETFPRIERVRLKGVIISAIVIGVVVLLLRKAFNKMAPKSNPAGEPDDEFETITDPEEREQAEELLNEGQPVDLHLNEGETQVLPSGTKVEKTDEGYRILHR